MDHVEEFLKELPLFRSFSQKELSGLIEKGQFKTFAPQEVIINFGQPGSFLGIICEGEAEAVVTGKLGARQRLGLLKRGDFFGEMSLLTGEPTMADVVALEATQVFLIPLETFSAFLAVNSEAVKILARAITERVKIRLQNGEVQARVGDAWRTASDPYGLRLYTANPAKILVMNCGSSSLKFGYYDTGQETNNLEGMVERIGQENSRIISSSNEGKNIRELGFLGYGKAFEAVLVLLTDHTHGVIRDPNELTAVGHRVVHGGEKYSSAVMIDDEVIKEIEKNSCFARLHNPLNLMIIKESMKLMPRVPQVAVFDTSFHQKMPAHAYLYGLPYDFYEKLGIRRYGFHGISHNYVALRAAAFLKRDFHKLKIITCHLGNGASLCAIDHGRSVDTTMGLTPSEGLVMGTRSGDLDPSILIYLCKEKGLLIEEIDEILNRQSGLKGLSGVSSDFRELADAANKGEARALLTIQIFCYRIRKYIGAYIAALGGLDALVFTGGIGEGSEWVRSLACQGLSYMGIRLNDILNRTTSPRPGEVAEISDEISQVKVLLIPTDEGRMIARETIRTLGCQNVAQVIKSQEQQKIPIEVSAHHVHLSRDVVDAIFGPGYELTPRSDLSQPGQYACKEMVTLVGPNGRVERVRVLAPLRKQTQVEISMTEEFKLGIQAPIRASGDLKGSPGLFIEGPAGRYGLSQGVICALRHIHMPPEDALHFGIKDRDIVMVRVEGNRTLVFGDVLVRVDPDFQLSMHIDTDEANAASIRTGMVGHLIGVQDRR